MPCLPAAVRPTVVLVKAGEAVAAKEGGIQKRMEPGPLFISCQPYSCYYYSYYYYCYCYSHHFDYRKSNPSYF